MGLTEEEIEALRDTADETHVPFLRNPLSHCRPRHRAQPDARTIGRHRKEIFTVAELSTVWIEMAVAPSDLPFAKEGQEVRIHSGAQDASARSSPSSPVIDPETRSAKAIAEIDNASGAWQLGDFVAAQLKPAARGQPSCRATRCRPSRATRPCS